MDQIINALIVSNYANPDDLPRLVARAGDIYEAMMREKAIRDKKLEKYGHELALASSDTKVEFFLQMSRVKEMDFSLVANKIELLSPDQKFNLTNLFLSLLECCPPIK